jgi:hypothetical protein
MVTQDTLWPYSSCSTPGRITLTMFRGMTGANPATAGNDMLQPLVACWHAQAN